MESLGEGYGLEDLRAVLLGKKAHTPRKKTVTQAEPPKVNLLVDIQAKLQAGKGAGYARWAKVFNLKQMAKTMNYLSEHNLLEYAVLEEKAAAATAHHNDLSAQIKAAEKRMAEIAVLRTHIVNYAKTREVYVAYRKAGYSKKFREEHEEEILLLYRSLIVDIPNQRAIQQGLCFDPKIVPGLAFAFGIGDQRCDQLQDVLFAMDIGERVIVHGLLEVDGI